jgi:hypothetical protein
MTRPILVRGHLAAAVGALVIISAFLVSSVATELFGSPGDVRVLRHGILLGLPLLIGCLAATALTGRRLAGRSRAPVVRRKQRRMQVVAAAGLMVLARARWRSTTWPGAPPLVPWRSPRSWSAA